MKTKNRKKNKGKDRGFTLIELMVATSIFVIIMLASMGALFTLLDAAKSSRALRTAMDNVNFAMESMTRSIRMGTNYYCVTEGARMPDESIVSEGGHNCFPDGGTLIAFISQPQTGETEGSLAGYKIANTGDYRTIQKCTSNNSSDCVSIISSDVNIDTLKFFVKGSAVDDKIQASVYIIMKGTVTTKNGPVSFSLQTMASQRNF